MQLVNDYVVSWDIQLDNKASWAVSNKYLTTSWCEGIGVYKLHDQGLSISQYLLWLNLGRKPLVVTEF